MDEKKILKRKRKAEIDNNKTLLLCACADLAELYIKRGQYQSAIQEYETIADIHKNDGRSIEYAKAHRAIGEAYMCTQNFEKALEHQKVYLDIALKEKDVLEQQRAYATIGHMYLSYYLETQLDSEKNLNAAYKYFMKSMVIAESLTGIHKLEKADMLARLLSNLGLVKESMGDYGKAKELLNRSIAICKQHDIYEQLSRGYTSVASVYDKRGECNEAIHHYNLAIDAAKKLKGNVDLMCAALLAKSEVLIKLTDFHGAKHILIKAYKLKTPNLDDHKAIERYLRTVATMCHIEDKLVVSCNDEKEKKKLYEKMGDSACTLKNYSKAIEYYTLMLKCAERSGNSGRELASCYYSLAETYKDNNQFPEAIEYFEKEYALCENLKDNLNTLSKIADTKEAASAPIDEVKTVYERALNNCRSSANIKEERLMLKRLIAYLRRMGDHADAFETEKYLLNLDEPDDNEDSSSSGTESDHSEPKSDIQYNLNLDDITDCSSDSDFEQTSNAETTTGVGKRKHRNFIIKKNAKGESQLHVACINGKVPVVRHLLEQGHPVNIRDNSGWLPLHEASNHGHLEIVRMLLDKGAAINDRGGTQCEGVTPIYDAANNGHVKIVELLLDKGASAIVKTDTGDTPLNVLKIWHHKNPFEGEEFQLYQQVVKQMSEAMEKVGQKVDIIDMTLEDHHCDEPKRDEDVSDLQQNEMDEEVKNTDESDFGEPFEDDEGELPGEVNSFSRLSMNMKYRKPKFRNTVRKKQALIPKDHTLDDWLEDDININRSAKKRRTTINESSISSSVWSEEPRNSKSPRASQAFPQKRTSSDSLPSGAFFNQNFDDSVIGVDARPAGNRKFSCSGKENTKKRSFHRVSSSGSISSNKITRYIRTPSFEESSLNQSTRNIVEPDSTTSRIFESSQAVSTTPHSGDLMVYVDVRIENMTFRIPVWISQIQSNTIGWLAEEASQKYARKECSKPYLELETATGALLSNEDPLSLLFPMGATQAEPVIARIVKLSLPPLVDRYKDACSNNKEVTNPTILQAIEEMSVRLSLENKGLCSAALAPICIALNHQTSLLELNLSANFLNSNCITKLCFVMPSLVNLTSLNLRCTGLAVSHLGEMVKMFSSATTPILEKLSHLDLSDNFLKNKSLRFLSAITKHLKLIGLSLSNIGLTRNLSDIDSEPLELTSVVSLDISDNRLGVEDIKKFVSWTNPSVISDLNISRNDKSNEGVLEVLVDHLRDDVKQLQLQSLNLSRCNVRENELYDLLRLCSGKSLKKLNLSYNSNLTGISLRRLLEYPSLIEVDLIGCENIFQYFDSCEHGILLERTIGDVARTLKLSTDLSVYSSQVEMLTEQFRKIYPELTVERGNAIIWTCSKKDIKKFEIEKERDL